MNQINSKHQKVKHDKYQEITNFDMCSINQFKNKQKKLIDIMNKLLIQITLRKKTIETDKKTIELQKKFTDTQFENKLDKYKQFLQEQLKELSKKNNHEAVKTIIPEINNILKNIEHQKQLLLNVKEKIENKIVYYQRRIYNQSIILERNPIRYINLYNQTKKEVDQLDKEIINIKDKTEKIDQQIQDILRTKQIQDMDWEDLMYELRQIHVHGCDYSDNREKFDKIIKKVDETLNKSNRNEDDLQLITKSKYFQIQHKMEDYMSKKYQILLAQCIVKYDDLHTIITTEDQEIIKKAIEDKDTYKAKVNKNICNFFITLQDVLSLINKIKNSNKLNITTINKEYKKIINNIEQQKRITCLDEIDNQILIQLLAKISELKYEKEQKFPDTSINKKIKSIINKYCSIDHNDQQINQKRQKIIEQIEQKRSDLISYVSSIKYKLNYDLQNTTQTKLYQYQLDKFYPLYHKYTHLIHLMKYINDKSYTGATNIDAGLLRDFIKTETNEEEEKTDSTTNIKPFLEPSHDKKTNIYGELLTYRINTKTKEINNIKPFINHLITSPFELKYNIFNETKNLIDNFIYDKYYYAYKNENSKQVNLDSQEFTCRDHTTYKTLLAKASEEYKQLCIVINKYKFIKTNKTKDQDKNNEQNKDKNNEQNKDKNKNHNRYNLKIIKKMNNKKNKKRKYHYLIKMMEEVKQKYYNKIFHMQMILQINEYINKNKSQKDIKNYCKQQLIELIDYHKKQRYIDIKYCKNLNKIKETENYLDSLRIILCVENNNIINEMISLLDNKESESESYSGSESETESESDSSSESETE